MTRANQRTSVEAPGFSPVKQVEMGRRALAPVVAGAEALNFFRTSVTGLKAGASTVTF
jgi:hypothetical protein